MPTLGLGHIASYLREYLSYGNIAVEITATNYFKGIKRQEPPLVGLTSVTRNYNLVVKLAAEVKSELDIRTKIGRRHITHLPYTLPKEFDVGVIGRGRRR